MDNLEYDIINHNVILGLLLSRYLAACAYF